MTDLVWLRGDRLSAAINPLGAELTHLRDVDDAELMTAADPAYWPRHAPLLFPAIGKTVDGTIRVDDVAYPMPKHGFARDLPFELVDHDDTHATFELNDDGRTRRAYPFAFRLQVEYRIEGATLSIEARLRNPAETELLAQFGFHPAFAWPLPYDAARSDHRILFECDEPERLSAITPDGLIAAETRQSPLDGRTLHLADALFEDDALVWNPVRSQVVIYGAAGAPQLRVAFPDTPALGIWTMPGASFVCIEPWHGIADPEGYAGEFRDKPGVFAVAPGATKTIAMNVTLVP